MKRMIVLVAIVSLLAGALFAEEAVLIDFSLLKADIHVSDGGNDQDTTPNQNRQTMMDYAQVAGGTFTTEQKQVMKTSLALANWEILLSSSSRNVISQGLSYVKEAPSKQFGTVMGVRVHFPVESFNAWARIKPPFEIPAYEPQATVGDDGSIQPTDGSNGITGINDSRFEKSYGVVKNVGTIKALAVNVYGLNFPHRVKTLIIDDTGTEKSMDMGYVLFDGWGELTWTNPAYVQEVRNRDIRLFPLYPFSTPFIKFAGFQVERDAAKMGGDFIVYFKDVKVIYDKAVLDTERDIEDEALWNIILDRESARKVWEMERFGHNQVLRYLDTQKQAQEPMDMFGRSQFTPSEGQQ